MTTTRPSNSLCEESKDFTIVGNIEVEFLARCDQIMVDDRSSSSNSPAAAVVISANKPISLGRREMNPTSVGHVDTPHGMCPFLDFEKPIAELERKIGELRRMSEPDGVDLGDEIARLTVAADRQLRTTYAKLTPWQKVMVARHPVRPKTSDYISALITEFTPLAGDRAFGDDPAVLGGLGRFNGRSVIVLGTEKGSDTESRLKSNFGMPRPEGYRKVRRLIELAGRFGLPLITFVDTPGAFPGIAAEARGQAEAIARSIEACLDAPVPFVATIIGEGGSGGAVALATGDCVLMLEFAIYSVISPEGCASILWRDAAQAPRAAEALRLTADDLLRLHLVDSVIPEPLGGAHRNPAATIRAVGEVITEVMAQLMSLDCSTLKARRKEKFLAMGHDAAGSN
jgi:acetyl-CoA carboxylase carboxyl transferase subunit alpha